MSRQRKTRQDKTMQCRQTHSSFSIVSLVVSPHVSIEMLPSHRQPHPWILAHGRKFRAHTDSSTIAGSAERSADRWISHPLHSPSQVICPAADFLLFLERAEALLDEAEKKRAVMLQFSDEDCEGRRICFLEESPTAKENFVQALTAIWLEKRNDHSMWF